METDVPERHRALNGFNQHVGMELVHLSADEVTVRLPITPDLLQVHGIVHGGVWCSLVETAASIGAGLWLEAQGGGDTVGVSNTTDFLRALREGIVTATATPVHRGRLQQLWDVEVRDESDRPIARGRVRLQNLEGAAVLGRPAS
ncbi:MAG TPA: PaaI family thioesterase [Mycobacteriales bacterium]|nr:PaaI family thioesterase [Mycobacteriales bacterium]